MKDKIFQNNSFKMTITPDGDCIVKLKNRCDLCYKIYMEEMVNYNGINTIKDAKELMKGIANEILTSADYPTLYEDTNNHNNPPF